MSSFARAAAPLSALALLPLLAACSGSGSPLSSSIPAASLAKQTQSVASIAGSKSPYTFTTLDNQNDPTFNQLLGINDAGEIAGYFGIGSAQHPNKGYTLTSPYTQQHYTNENFPNSVQTQVTGINNAGATVGFWVDGNNNNFGFTDIGGTFKSYSDPAGPGNFDQLLGINDKGLAVGFYTDGSGVNHGYELKLSTGTFTEILPPAGGTNLSATGIDNQNDVTGFYTNASGVVVGFIYKMHVLTTVSYPNAQATNPFGINEHDEMVGSYVDANGVMHGFTLKNALKKPTWASIDDPNGIGSTVVNGINTSGQLVGFYTDAAGNVDGFLAMKN